MRWKTKARGLRAPGVKATRETRRIWNVVLRRSHFGPGLLCHIREERFGVGVDLFFGQVLFVRGEGPLMAERIFDLAEAVTPELIGHRHLDGAAGLHRALEGSIRVLDVEIERDTGPAATFR